MNDELREGEVAVDPVPADDAGLRFVGVIRTPFVTREMCPRQGDAENGPLCRIEVNPEWEGALDGIERFEVIEVGDLTGDGEAEAIVLQADTAEAQVYENLGTGFATTPLEETILTGIDLNARAGGKVLDISVTDHLSNEGLNVVLLGETGTYFYELT